MPIFQGTALAILITLYPALSLFETQHQLTHPPVKSSVLTLRKMSVSQDVFLEIMFSYYPAFAIFDLVLILPLTH